MAISIGPKIGIDGEKEFRSQLKNIISEVKELDTHMKTVASSFNEWTSSEIKSAENTELLNKKLIALRDEYAVLSDALDKAVKKYGEGSTQANELRSKMNEVATEINKTNQALKENSGFAAFADNCKFVSEKMDIVAEKLEKVGSTMTRMVTGPLVALGAASVKEAASFESGMATVRAVTGATDEEFEQLSQQARDMAKTTVFSATEVTEAFKYMGMASWDTQDMMNGLSGVLNLAAASGEELGSVSDILTDVMTALGTSAADNFTTMKDGYETTIPEAEHYADVLATAAMNSNTNVELLGESFKYVAANGGAAGYTIEDLTVALGLMANAGIKGSTAGTALRQTIANFAQGGTTEKAKAVFEKLGLSMTNSDGSMKTLMQTMEDLRGAFGSLRFETEESRAAYQALTDQYEAGTISEEDYNEGLCELLENYGNLTDATALYDAQMIAGTRGMSGLLAIVNASDEDFNSLTESIYNSTGAAKEMADIKLDTFTGHLTIMKDNLAEAGITIGNALIPVLETFVEKIQSLAEWFQGLNEEQVQMIVKIGLVVAAIGPVITIIGKLISGISGVVNVVGIIGGAIPAIAGFVTSTLIPAISGITAIFGPLIAIISTIAGFVTSTLIPAIVGLVTTFAPVIAIIAAVVAAGVLLYKNWDKLKEGAIIVKNTIKEGWAEAKQNTVNFVNGMSNLFDSFKAKVSTAFDSVKNKIKDTFLGLVSSAKNWARDMIDGFIGGITEKIQAVKDAATNVANAVSEFLHFSRPDKGPLRYYEQWMPDMMQGLANGIRTNIPVVTSALEDLGIGVEQSVHHTNVGGVNMSIYGAQGQDERVLAQYVMDEMVAKLKLQGASL